MTPEVKLVSMGLVLPLPLAPRGNYIPYRRVGDLIYLAGHGPRLQDNTYRVGRINSPDDIPSGQADAQLTALNMLSTLKGALGELNRIQAIVRVFGMINAGPTFVDHPKVMDGFSSLLVDVLGDAGRHTRTSVGMHTLPNGMTVEVDAIVHVW